MNQESESVRCRILALALNEWNVRWRNRQQLLSRLGRKHSIIYCTGALSVWNRKSMAWHDAPLFSYMRRANQVLIDYPGKLTAKWPRYPALDSLAVRRTARRWQKVINKQPGKYRIAYVFHPSFWPYIQHLSFEKLIYHAYDLFSKTPSWDSLQENWEKLLLQKADLVIASSQTIAYQLSTCVARDIMVVPNGVDYESFADENRKVPEDLKQIPSPRVGYVGQINMKVDFALLIYLARKHKNLNFVLVGGLSKFDEKTQKGYEQAQTIDNIYFLGEKSHEIIPNYMHGLDVGLMCYRTGVNLWSDAIYPLKMHEYLAAGLPVVSADVASVREFSHVVRIATNKEDWSTALLTSLKDVGADIKSLRREIAEKHSWNTLSDTIDKSLQSLIQTTSQPIK